MTLASQLRDHAGAALLALSAELRLDPARMLHSGLFRVSSAYEIAPDGSRAPAAEAYSFSRPFRLNRVQRALDAHQSVMRRSGMPRVNRVLKARNVGLSTYTCLRAVSVLLWRSACDGLIVSHTPKSAEIIYRIASRAIASLPDGIRPSLPRDSKEYLEIHAPAFGVSDSSLACLSATDRIESARGDRLAFLQRDECSRYQEPERVHAALTSVVMQAADAETWDVTTARGRDGYFYPAFMEDWSAQGAVNPWERGFRPGYGRGTAWFFPWYFLYEGHELALHPEVTVEALRDSLDEEEKYLWAKIVAQWEDVHCPDAVDRAARQINWRRAMIHDLKPGWPIGPFTETPLSRDVFAMEYPDTVEEAFSASAGRTIADASVMEELRGHLRPPRVAGRVYPELEAPVVACPDGSARAFLWKLPGECAHDLWLCFDPSEGVAGGNAMGDDLAVDRTWAVIFERTPQGVFEQVAEYRSQETLDVTSAAIYALAAWYARGREDPPLVCGEIQFGKTALNYFLSRGYPRGRLAPRRGAARTRGEFWFSASSVRDKILAGHALFTRLRSRRIILRSEALWKEARFYTEGPDGIFHALNKGRGGEASKDDGMTALSILAWLDEQIYGAIGNDPWGEAEELESGSDYGWDGPAWSGDNIAPVMKMLLDNPIGSGASDDTDTGPDPPAWIGPF